MEPLHIAALVLLILAVVPVPLAWLIGTIFPDGNVKSQADRFRSYVRREWKRLLVCAAAIALAFVLMPDHALQVLLIGAAILAGRWVAVARSRRM